MSQKHIAKQSKNGVFVLERDGMSCQCPKAMIALPQQNAVGGMQFFPARMECSTLCPLASIKEKQLFDEAENGGSIPTDETIAYYVIECEGRTKEIKLDDLVKYKEPTGLIAVTK